MENITSIAAIILIIGVAFLQIVDDIKAMKEE